MDFLKRATACIIYARSMHAWVRACMCACICTCVRVSRARGVRLGMRAYECVFVRACARACMCVHVCVCACVCMYACVCT